MSKKAKKARKINKTLERHVVDFDQKRGTILINDFMQVSQALDRLKESDNDAFQILYASISKNIEQAEIIRERGSRIAKLQRGQTQPK